LSLYYVGKEEEEEEEKKSMKEDANSWARFHTFKLL
jgi:hypothetical protein